MFFAGGGDQDLIFIPTSVLILGRITDVLLKKAIRIFWKFYTLHNKMTIIKFIAKIEKNMCKEFEEKSILINFTFRPQDFRI